MPELNLPDAVAEVSAAFQGYEKALMANDVAALNGVGENLYSFDQICSFRSASRAARPPDCQHAHHHLRARLRRGEY
jgi:hypothetical protein